MSMNFLTCIECNNTYPLSDPIWRCSCGGLLDIEFEAAFPIKKIAERKPTMWRYREAIPIVEDKNIITFDEGFTPLIPVAFNERSVLVKQDHVFASGSYKDRGATVLISKIKELGISHVIEDSSGNAGCAIAMYCAKANITCDIYVPAKTSPGKLAQIEHYGANVDRIMGSREDCAKAALSAAAGHYYASHSWNPFFFHGTKTFAFEICEQLNWEAPDTVILPVGNGTLLLGAYIGFSELVLAGVIEKIPKLIGVQSTNCAPLYKTIKSDLPEVSRIDPKPTIAEGIAIAEPVRGKQIIKAVKESGGDILVVNDSEIQNSLLSMEKNGFYIEPTSAATTAGVNKYLENRNRNDDDDDELIVSVFTGSGLKYKKMFRKKNND